MTPQRMREIADELQALAESRGYDRWHAERSVSFTPRGLRGEADRLESDKHWWTPFVESE